MVVTQVFCAAASMGELSFTGVAHIMTYVSSDGCELLLGNDVEDPRPSISIQCWWSPHLVRNGSGCSNRICLPKENVDICSVFVYIELKSFEVIPTSLI